MLSQPIERAIPTIDGRWKFDDSNRRASGHGTGRPGRVDRLEREVAAEGRRETIARRRARSRARPCPPGRAATSAPRRRRRRRPVAASSTGIAPALWAPSTTTSAPRAWAISAIPAIGMIAPVAHSTWETATSRVRSSIAASKAARIAAGSRPGADVDEGELDAEAVAQVDTARRCRPDARGVVVTARSPGCQSIDQTPMFIPSVAAWVSAISADIRDQHGGDRGPCLGHPLERLVEVVGVGATGRQLVRRDLGHRRGGLGRQRARPSRC